jgi:hypothetical protein
MSEPLADRALFKEYARIFKGIFHIIGGAFLAEWSSRGASLRELLPI